MHFQRRHSSSETFSRRIIGKTDNAHKVYYETISVRYTLVQSRSGGADGAKEVETLSYPTSYERASNSSRFKRFKGLKFKLVDFLKEKLRKKGLGLKGLK